MYMIASMDDMDDVEKNVIYNNFKMQPLSWSQEYSITAHKNTNGLQCFIVLCQREFKIVYSLYSMGVSHDQRENDFDE